MLGIRVLIVAAVVAAGVGGVIAAGPAFAAEEDSRVADLEAKVQAMQSRIDELERKEAANWLTQERTEQIKAIVAECLADAKSRGQFADSDLQAGYNNGFFISSGKDFKLVVGGYVQLRYTYACAEDKNAEAFPEGVKHGDDNGFDFRRARLIFSGYAFSPDLTYLISGDFAGAATNNNNFQILDAYIAYKISDLVAIRGGSMLAPFSYWEYATAGSQFPEGPTVLLPFDPIRTLGLSVYGQPIKNKWSYEVQVNNGSRSNSSGKATDSATGKLDNRMGFYARTQFAGSGVLADFADEPDLRKDTSTFVWMLAGAAGYESQNAASDAFPAAQSSAAVPGLSTADSPGFLGSRPLNGDLYRATVDAHAKYMGFSAQAGGFIQQVNYNPGAGVTLPYGVSDASFFETGYFAQAGYFLIPKRLEVAGRFEQLLTEGYPNRMEVYTLGLNYYFFGHNVKLQSDITYIPNEAAFTDASTVTHINTEEIIYRLQLQVKF